MTAPALVIGAMSITLSQRVTSNGGTPMTEFTRRTTLAAFGAALAAPALIRTTPTLAKAKMLGAARPTHFRFPLGDFEVTTIFDGSVTLGGPHPIFGENVDAKEVAAFAEANNLPSDTMEIGFTVTLVNTGSELVLFDTGNDGTQRPSAGKLRARMEEAGYSPEDVDVVVLTHFHGDHIGGMMVDGKPAFPNARYVTSAKEYDHWVKADHALTKKNVVPFAEKMTFIKDGESVVSGIDAVSANGHTPGHTVFHVESSEKRVLITGDTANHFVASLERPDWHVRFDMDKEGAVAARKKVFGMLAADGIPFIGYHMPYPAVGYVQNNGSGGFRYSAASYQLFV